MGLLVPVVPLGRLGLDRPWLLLDPLDRRCQWVHLVRWVQSDPWVRLIPVARWVRVSRLVHAARCCQKLPLVRLRLGVMGCRLLVANPAIVFRGCRVKAQKAPLANEEYPATPYYGPVPLV